MFLKFYRQRHTLQLVLLQGFLCEKFELSAMECMEYYGVKQGLTACRDYYDDMMECKFKVEKFFHYFYFYNAFL